MRVLWCAQCFEPHDAYALQVNGYSCDKCGGTKFVTEQPVRWRLTRYDWKFLKAVGIDPEQDRPPY